MSLTSVRHIVWDWNGTLWADNEAVLQAVNIALACQFAGVDTPEQLVELCRTRWNDVWPDDGQIVLAAVAAICADHGRSPLTLDEWRAVFSRPLIACYERILDRSLTVDDWAAIDRCYHAAYRTELVNCGLAEGVPDELHRWRGAGRTQSLLSMWSHDELVPLVTELSLSGLFARVDGLRGFNMGGSKAAYLIEHLKAQQLDPTEVVLIGDVVDDAEAAAEAGARCVLVSTGVMDRARLETAGVPVADSIPEALTLFSA